MLTAREHAAEAYEAEHGNGSRDNADIDQWVTDFLGAGSQKSNDVFSAADAAGFSKDQAKRAKRRLGVEARRPGGEGPWYWSLPELGSDQGGITKNVLPSSLGAPSQVSDGKAREHPKLGSGEQITDHTRSLACSGCGDPLWAPQSQALAFAVGACVRRRMTAAVIDRATVVRVHQPRRRGENRTVVIKCPHCGKRHVHGWPLDHTEIGSRVAHCSAGRGLDYNIITPQRKAA